MNADDLRARVRNPNKEFDSYFWRPRQLWLRRFLAKYITYIEITAYAFIVLLTGGIVYAWTVTHKEWTGFCECKLTPAGTEVRAPAGGVLDSVFVANFAQVTVDQRLAAVRGPHRRSIIVTAPSAGVVSFAQADSAGRPLCGTTVDSNALVCTILNFAVFTAEVEFTGNNIDSVSPGDSAEVEIQKRSALDLVVNLDTPDTTLSLRIFSLDPDEQTAFFDTLKKTLQRRTVTARQQGLYEVTGVSMPRIVVELEARPGEPADDPTLRATARRFSGVFEGGVRHMKLELAKPFNDSAMQALRRWVRRTLERAAVSVDHEQYSLDTAVLVLAKTVTVDCEAPLDRYVGYRRRPRRMKEHHLKEFKVKGTVRVDNPPAHVQRLARELYLARREFLDVNVRVNSFRTSWGRKLIRRK